MPTMVIMHHFYMGGMLSFDVLVKSRIFAGLSPRRSSLLGEGSKVMDRQYGANVNAKTDGLTYFYYYRNGNLRARADVVVVSIYVNPTQVRR